MIKFKVGDIVRSTLKGQFRYNTLGRVEEYSSGLYLVRWRDGERNWVAPTALDVEEAPGPCATDVVNSPKHYQFFPDLEAIAVIAMCMTQEQFYGYCLGNRLKYRLRAGNKDKLEQDIAKSDKYLELYEKHKGLCSDAK